MNETTRHILNDYADISNVLPKGTPTESAALLVLAMAMQDLAAALRDFGGPNAHLGYLEVNVNGYKGG